MATKKITRAMRPRQAKTKDATSYTDAPSGWPLSSVDVLRAAALAAGPEDALNSSVEMPAWLGEAYDELREVSQPSCSAREAALPVRERDVSWTVTSTPSRIASRSAASFGTKSP